MTGNANLQYQSDKPNLTFDTATVNPDPQLAQAGATTSFASTTGTFDPDPINFDSERKIRCDKNRHVVVEYTTFVLVSMDGLWLDSEPVVVTVGGFSGGAISNSTAQDAFIGSYPLFPKPPRERIQISPAVAPFTKSNSGSCRPPEMECVTFGFATKLKPEPVPN
jgi:hypothetical protein